MAGGYKRKVRRKKLGIEFELPLEVVLDSPKVTIIGDDHCQIDNFTNVIEFNDRRMSFGYGENASITVTGENLSLENIEGSCARIKGKIFAATLIGGV